MTEKEHQEALSFIAAIANDRLIPFCQATMKSYEPLWYHIKVAHALEMVECGAWKYVIITMPPQHGKSELSSIRFPMWALGRDPTRKIIEVSFAAEVASKFGREVRNTIKEPMYKRIFPNTTIRPDSNAANRFNTTENGVYIAAGRGGSITSYGADIMILDDMFKNKEEAYSATIRDKVWDEYVYTLKTRCHGNSAIVMLMTRWHDDDLIGRVIEKEGLIENGGKWRLIEIPAIAKEDEEHRKKGEALWPSKYPIEYLEDIRKVSPDAFECMYQCSPVNEENAEFHRRMFKYYRDEQCPGNLNVYMTVDPAIGQKQENDETSIMVCGVAPDGAIYLLDMSHGRWDPSTTIAEIFRLAELYEPSVVGVEAIAYQEALRHFLEKEMMRRYRNDEGKIFNIEPIKSSTKKEFRIRALIPYYKQGLIYHREGVFDQLESQLLRFPKAKHDDIMDSLAMQVQLWQAPRPKQVKKKKGISRLDMLKKEGFA